MLDLKPYGAFIEHTIRPLIEEAQNLISDLHSYDLYLDKEDLYKIGKFIADKHLKVVIVQSITGVLICGIICLTLWKTYRL